jgi:hypothetical protein
MIGLCFKCSFKILNVLEDNFGFEKHNKFLKLYLSINVKKYWTSPWDMVYMGSHTLNWI